MATMSAVVKTEARTIFMKAARRTETARRRITQLGGNQNAANVREREDRRSAFDAQRKTLLNSAQARPIVGHQDRITRIRWIVLHAGWLTRDQPFEANLPLKASDVLRGVISNARNGVA